MKVRITLNQEKLLNTLRFAFTHRDALVCELLHNARRAGASRVVIDYDEAMGRLSVSDDGCGIGNFQSLFTLCESGWSASIREAESPYGLGFLSCLYRAKTCSIVSLGRELRFDTQALLAGVEIEDQRSNETIGITRVTLYGVRLEGLAQRIDRLVCGFPIPVVFNDACLPRPFALDRVETQPSQVGQVHLLGRECGPAGTSCLLFLQGHLVHGDWEYGRYSNIVHLDSRQFRARLPDRDTLIDEDQALAQVDAALRNLWRDQIRQAKDALDATELIDRYFQAAKTWGLLEEFNTVAALPGSIFRRITDYPYQAGYREETFLTPLHRPVLRAEMEEARIKLVELETFSPRNAPLWMYARERQLVCFEDPGLSDTHWVRPYVRHLNEESFHVDILGEVIRAPLHGAFLWREVVMCEAYAIVVGEDRVRIRENGLAWPCETSLLVPEEESSGQAVEQASDFIDSQDRFHEEDLDADRDALRDLIRLLRAKDPKQALESLLSDLSLGNYPSLRGRSFTLRVGSESQTPEVEILH